MEKGDCRVPALTARTDVRRCSGRTGGSQIRGVGNVWIVKILAKKKPLKSSAAFSKFLAEGEGFEPQHNTRNVSISLILKHLKWQQHISAVPSQSLENDGYVRDARAYPCVSAPSLKLVGGQEKGNKGNVPPKIDASH